MTQTSPSKTSTPPRGEPPKWAIERFFDSIGAVPAAIGKALDRAAKIPALKPLIWIISSVWLGLLWIALIGLYVAIGTAVTSIRAHFEMTDLEFFDAWPMQILLWLMSITLICVTLRRIRLKLFTLGVWTVHIGILVLVLGCVIYFTNKYEGLAQIYLNKSVDCFYDSTERALYVYKVDDEDNYVAEKMIRLPRMPIYHEYLTAYGNPLNRVVPNEELAKLDPALADVPVIISGYYPAAGFNFADWTPGTPSKAVRRRGIMVTVTETSKDDKTPPRTSPKWLVAGIPPRQGGALGETLFEYLYKPSPERIADLTAEFKAPAAVTVRIAKLNYFKSFPCDKKGDIKLEGTPYTLTPLGPQEAMPLMTEGYKGTGSDGFMFGIKREGGDPKSRSFQRFVVTRFPEISNDFLIVNGQPQRQKNGLVDPDIQLTFHQAASDTVWILEDSPGEITLIHRLVGGAIMKKKIQIGETTHFEFSDGASCDFAVAAANNNMYRPPMPVVIPPQQREARGSTTEWIANGCIELKVGDQPTQQTLYLPFSQFGRLENLLTDRQKPPIVTIPGKGNYAFVLSSTRRPLPASVRLDKFQFITQGASTVPEDFISTLSFTPKNGEPAEKIDAKLNAPAVHMGLTYSQSGWDTNPKANDEDRFTVLNIGNRPGTTVMLLGCTLMGLGILYAFYVKPILLEAKRKQLAAWSQGGRP